MAHVSTLSLSFGLALCLISQISSLRQHMCSAMLPAMDGEDFTALQKRVFFNFRSKCRQPTRAQPTTAPVSCSFTTNPTWPRKYRYILKPLSMPFRLEFTVKAKNDALVVLAEADSDQSIFLEIGFGGWYDTKTVIRACHGDTCKQLQVEHLENGILSEDEYRPFWIEYIEGAATVGKGGQQEGFMQWNASAYHGKTHSVAHIGIAMGPVVGYWVFNTFCE